MGKAETQQGSSGKRDLSKVPKQLRDHCFEKGQSGNPGGMAPGTVSLRREILNRLASDPNLKAEIVENLFTLARDGDHKALAAIREILDRTDGKVPQHIDAKVDGDITVRCKLT